MRTFRLRTPVGCGLLRGGEVELSFGLGRGEIAGHRARAGRIVTGALAEGRVVAFAGFDPSFPGAYRFRPLEPRWAHALLESMRGDRFHAKLVGPVKTLLLLSLVCLSACSAVDPSPEQGSGGPSPSSTSPGGKGDSPYADGGTCECSGEACTMLALVNAARSEARSCGTEAMPPAPALYFDCRLESAAKRHAEDMAQHDFFAHQGSDGSTVKERVTEAGFEWWTVGENIAAGQTDPEAAMQGWLESPGHCKNLMKPSFGYFGGAHATNAASQYQDYWVQVFAGL